MNKWRIVIWILGIICFIFNIFTPFFIIWTHVSLQVLFYIDYFHLYIIYIFILLNEISIYGKYLKNFKNKLEKYILSFNLIVFSFFIFFYITLFINSIDFQKFMRNCPFYLDKLDYSLNFDRRCDLYDTNYNSRYTYQYICSYDSSKEFAQINTKMKLKQEVEPDIVICNKFNELIDNNIINKFKDVYKKKDKYYCSRTNKPQENDYSFAKAKDCRMTKNTLLLFGFIAYIFPMWYFLVILIFKRKRFRERRIDIHANLSLDRNFNLNNSINLRRNIIILNNANSSNNSTERSENPGRNINFRSEKTINIIIENKKEFIINQNIKNIFDKTNKMANHINSENINEFNLNSEEVIIRRTDINENNINNQ
jgi:hypothetical protein